MPEGWGEQRHPYPTRAKYRAVLTAEAALDGERIATRVLLVMGGAATGEVISVANRLDIPVLENVSIPKG